MSQIDAKANVSVAMTQEDINKDRETRKNACTEAIEKVLRQYEFTLIAEDHWTPSTKMTVEIKLADFKKYEVLTVTK